MGGEPEIPDDFIDDRPVHSKPERRTSHLDQTTRSERRSALPVSSAVVAWICCAVLAFFFVCYLAYKELPRDILPPGPTPAPVIDGPLRVILVTDPDAALNQKQDAVLHSTKVRGWLKEHAAKAGDGLPAWRAWPKDVDPAGESADWQQAWESAKTALGTLPAVAIFKGKAVRMFPLPDSEDAMVSLLEKQGLK